MVSKKKIGVTKKKDVLDIIFSLFTDPVKRKQFYANKKSIDVSGRLPLLAPEDIGRLSNQFDRILLKSVMFGRPPDMQNLLAELFNRKIEREPKMPMSDFIAALWRAIRDSQFRLSCFGDARTTLIREGYVLTEDEIGKFRWFDHERLAELEQTFEKIVENTIFTQISEEVSNDLVGEDKLGLYTKLWKKHSREVNAIRDRALELLEGAPQYTPGEFDPGPPAPDEPTFKEVLQLIRAFGSNLNKILQCSGYSIGRVLMIHDLLKRTNTKLPEFQSPLIDDPISAKNWFAEISSGGRPKIDEHYHQSPCSPYVVIDRVSHIMRHIWLKDEAVLVLGDDDALSVALAAFTEAEVHVIDIDPRVLNFLSTVAERASVHIEFHEHDLKKPLPSHLIDRFSLVTADPPQSLSGELFFLDRAIDALRSELGYRIYTSITPLWMGTDAVHSIVSHMASRGFAPREIIKSQMEFPVRNCFETPSGNTSTAALFDAIMEETLHMCSDAYIFQRMKFI